MVVGITVTSLMLMVRVIVVIVVVVGGGGGDSWCQFPTNIVSKISSRRL